MRHAGYCKKEEEDVASSVPTITAAEALHDDVAATCHHVRKLSLPKHAISCAHLSNNSVISARIVTSQQEQ